MTVWHWPVVVTLKRLLDGFGACASDAFYPFPDGVEAAADAGAAIIVQPGGSMNDDKTIAAADARGIAMVFTGERHFLH